MTARVEDLPATAPPIMVEAVTGSSLYGRFTTNWLGWFRNLVRAVQDAQASAQVAVQDFRTFVGPGPLSLSLNISTTRDCTLSILGSVVQSFVTAAPSWALHLIVDGVDHNTGTVANWQGVAVYAVNVPVAKGNHVVTLQWVASSANGSVNSRFLSATPIYN